MLNVSAVSCSHSEMLLGSPLTSAAEGWTVSPTLFTLLPLNSRQLDSQKLNEQMVQLHHVSECSVAKGTVFRALGPLWWVSVAVSRVTSWLLHLCTWGRDRGVGSASFQEPLQL